MTVTLSLALARHSAEALANIAMETHSADAAQSALDIIHAIEETGERPGVAKLVENDLNWIVNK